MKRLSEKSSSDWLVSCARSSFMIGWIWLVVRIQIPRSAALFGGEDTDVMLLGEETDLSLLYSHEPGC